MNNVNKTLYIPLYGKAYVSKEGILLDDPKAEQIWAAEGFALKGKSRSKWLAYYMGMRSAVFDRWLRKTMDAAPEAVILHLGCGMDSRCLRVEHRDHMWFDVDFPDVIQQRKRYYSENSHYRMIGADLRSGTWLEQIPGKNAMVVMEGVSMYLPPEELTSLLAQIAGHFETVELLMDCYTQFAARASRFKNPINDVGVTKVYGMDDPKFPEQAGFRFTQELEMTPADLIDQLSGVRKPIFRKVFAGSFSKKLYKLYAYRKP